MSHSIMINITTLFQPQKILPHIIPLAKHNSKIHGVAHWTRVHRFGLLLAESLKLSEEQRIAIALFGWTHDLARTDDGGGNLHAIYGEKHVQYVIEILFNDFPDPILEIVKMAILYHSDGLNIEEAVSELPIMEKSPWSREATINTIGCCWDADRLDLLRLSILPKVSKMSTPYWQDILPLAAKLNKQSSLLNKPEIESSNIDEWFTSSS